ncbi:serine O-acetyltransferase [Prosthecobacter debontii]|uniref:Serine O-acetyltransferase n=1 Tax=Prosthecobacter debontii TaxID=48467 RepID=A0A1T4YVB5_9BACT|nr:hypothetical protein [Prosthecobacter debontii]SKB05754.1 serine O-acetyltransferase [Prosthecobacter debontii]
MTFTEWKQHVKADQFRYAGSQGRGPFIRTWFSESGFRFTLVMRLCRYLRSQPWSRYGLYHLCLLWHRRQQVRYGAYIDFMTEIGPGLYLGHLVSIVVNRRTVIGANCSISQGITLGQTNARSKRPGCPSLGDRVYIGCGAVVVGGIHLGNDSAVAPNAVVIRDVGASEVVSGNPATVISTRGSEGYVSHCAEIPEAK